MHSLRNFLTIEKPKSHFPIHASFLGQINIVSCLAIVSPVTVFCKDFAPMGNTHLITPGCIQYSKIKIISQAFYLESSKSELHMVKK